MTNINIEAEFNYRGNVQWLSDEDQVQISCEKCKDKLPITKMFCIITEEKQYWLCKECYYR